MTNELPLVPSIDYLRHGAKNLFELCRVGDSGAVKQLCSVFPEFLALSLIQIATSVRLHHAQDVIACLYGYHRWHQLCESVEIRRRTASALSAAMEDPKMADVDYRAGIARSKGLPEIGTSRLSQYGVRYDVVDFMPAATHAGAARVRAGGPKAHINDLLPVIAFPEMTDRLYQLYVETDCVTTKPLIFFDTMSGVHPSTAAPGSNCALSLSVAAPVYIHFDARELHETIIAHELGHIWVETVEQIEDYRHLRDQSDLPRITQFYHVQSFVLDLCVNDMLARRGFDMSIIAQHQAESICNFADSCARGKGPSNKRVLAGTINAIAGALLEMEWFPDQWSTGIKNALEMIEIGLPEAFEPAKGFVRSVLRHGYADSAAVMRAVDECARISFNATGECFDPDKDLIEVANVEPKWDKRPGFLRCLPLSAKREVCRETAKHGITSRAKYDIVVSYPNYANVVVTDPEGAMAEPIRLSYNLPVLPHNPYRMPGAPTPYLPIGSGNIAPTGVPHPHSAPPTPPRVDPFAAVHSIAVSGFGSNFDGNQNSGYQPPAPSPCDGFSGFPDSIRKIPASNSSPGMYGQTASGSDPFGMRTVTSLPDPWAEARRRNEEQQKARAEEEYRRRQLQQEMQERHYESYSGRELKPTLTPAGEQYAKMHPRRSIEPPKAIRNYMAGEGRFISRVGFDLQMAGEHPYGYANNNPVNYIDPDSNSPQKQKTHKPCTGDDLKACIDKGQNNPEFLNCTAFTKDCLSYIFSLRTDSQSCFSGSGDWTSDMLTCACQGTNSANPLLLLAIAWTETHWGTLGKGRGLTLRCHDPFGVHFQEVGSIEDLCKAGGVLPTFTESACRAAYTISRDKGVKPGVWGRPEDKVVQYCRYKCLCEKVGKK